MNNEEILISQYLYYELLLSDLQFLHKPPCISDALHLFNRSRVLVCATSISVTGSF